MAIAFFCYQHILAACTWYDGLIGEILCHHCLIADIELPAEVLSAYNACLIEGLPVFWVLISSMVANPYMVIAKSSSVLCLPGRARCHHLGRLRAHSEGVD